jgi:hypothetical protein
VIDAVLLFGFLNIVFELVLLNMMPPRTRLRVLGSQVASNALHLIFLGLNLLIHWGTLVGTMSGVMAFCASIVTVHIARKVYGSVTGTNYHVGWIKYSIEELR